MKYNFDQPINRLGTNSYKWDSPDAQDCLPLWVADMDFQTATPIIDALRKRVEHGIFGYTQVPNDYYHAIINWFARRYGWIIPQEQILYTTGVVPAISAILRALSKPGDKVVVNTPAYNCFFSSIRNLDCELVESPLICDDSDNLLYYRFDYEHLGKVLKDAQFLILCNPHNPTGRCWTKTELQELETLCRKHNVFVISDEVHGDLTFPQFQYTPWATIATSSNWCTCTSCTKAFNIAGLQIANIIVPDSDIRQRIDKGINIHEICDVNPFGVIATIAAYNESEDWLSQLNDYVHDNYLFLKEQIAQSFPQWQLTRSESTYLAWIRIKNYDMPTGDTPTPAQYIKQLTGVMFGDGAIYHDPRFIRINMACPKQTLSQAIERVRRCC